MIRTIPSKLIKAALRIAAKQDIRHYINGVLIEVSPTEIRVVATDGHRAVVLRKVEASSDTFSFILPRATAELAVASKQAELVLTVKPAYSIGGIAFAPVDGKFPDYRRIIPSDWSYEAASYNPEFLVDFEKIRKDLGVKGGMIVRQNGNDAAMVHFYAHDDCIGVVMPRRDFNEKTPDLGAPTWGKL